MDLRMLDYLSRVDVLPDYAVLAPVLLHRLLLLALERLRVVVLVDAVLNETTLLRAPVYKSLPGSRRERGRLETPCGSRPRRWSARR